MVSKSWWPIPTIFFIDSLPLPDYFKQSDILAVLYLVRVSASILTYLGFFLKKLFLLAIIYIFETFLSIFMLNILTIYKESMRSQINVFVCKYSSRRLHGWFCNRRTVSPGSCSDRSGLRLSFYKSWLPLCCVEWSYNFPPEFIAFLPGNLPVPRSFPEEGPTSEKSVKSLFMGWWSGGKIKCD